MSALSIQLELIKPKDFSEKCLWYTLSPTGNHQYINNAIFSIPSTNHHPPVNCESYVGDSPIICHPEQQLATNPQNLSVLMAAKIYLSYYGQIQESYSRIMAKISKVMSQYSKLWSDIARLQPSYVHICDGPRMVRPFW